MADKKYLDNTGLAYFWSKIKNYLLTNYVGKETGKRLMSDDEGTKLAGLENYDDTAVRGLIDGKVDKVTGSRLMTDTEGSKLEGIEANANKYVLPTASAETLGGIKVGSNLSITNGVLSASAAYELPTASSTVLGGIKVGSRLSINNGVLSADERGGSYELPVATSSTLGGIKIGSGLSITDGVCKVSGKESTGNRKTVIDDTTVASTSYYPTCGAVKTFVEGKGYITASDSQPTSFITGLDTSLSNLQQLAEGKRKTIVLKDVNAIATYLAVAENLSAMKTGDVFLLTDQDIPDYWFAWKNESDHTQGWDKYELEGRKFDLPVMDSDDIDEIMAS